MRRISNKKDPLKLKCDCGEEFLVTKQTLTAYHGKELPTCPNCYRIELDYAPLGLAVNPKRMFMIFDAVSYELQICSTNFDDVPKVEATIAYTSNKPKDNCLLELYKQNVWFRHRISLLEKAMKKYAMQRPADSDEERAPWVKDK